MRYGMNKKIIINVIVSVMLVAFAGICISNFNFKDNSQAKAAVSGVSANKTVTSSAVSAAAVAEKNSLAHAAYKTKLVDLNTKWNKYYASYESDGSNYFKIYDINGDGIDECIVERYDSYNNSEKLCGSTDVAIYTYYNGAIKKLVYSTTCGGTWGGIYFYKNCKYINMYARAIDEYDCSLNKIKNGKLVEYKDFHCLYSSETDKYVYEINDKVVTEKVYNKKYDKLTAKQKMLKFYKISSSNLSKHIK